MSNISLILGSTNTLILGKDKSLLCFKEIEEVRKMLLKRLIFKPKIIVCSHNKEEIDNIQKILKPRKIYFYEKSKAILLSRDIDITKTSSTIVVDINSDINIGIVSLGTVIINKTIPIKKDKSEDIVKSINKEIKNLKIEVLNDIREKGIILSGDNKLLYDIKEDLRKVTGIPVFVSNVPNNDAINGIKLILKDLSLLKY